ncbi:MAG TPA: DHH family phosphoesterase, partial [Candidatus Thermoplasmatota archaeon]|nr:DHH family phosphoesterase [Candidatus Thermoplasmatota archaeon]
GREGRPDVGIAYLLGDPQAKAEANGVFEAYRAAVAAGVERLRREGPAVRGALQVAWTERADYTGMVAGLGMTHVVADRSRPLAVLARRPDGLVQVSTRGTHEQMKAGLDLGRAVQIAATAVGSEGGGHPDAAGAVVSADKVEPFLAALDAALTAQGFLGRGA